MSNLEAIVGDEGRRIKKSVAEADAWNERPIAARQIKEQILQDVLRILEFVDVKGDRRTFRDVEGALIAEVFMLGRLFTAYFLTRRQEGALRRVGRRVPVGYRSGRSQSRLLGTSFGKVRYWRSYTRESGKSRGTYPLDIELGLSADGFSMTVLSLAARLATLVTFDQASALLVTFLSWSPAKRTIENTVLGLGRYTGEWFESAPPPEGDGEVLVIQIDSKAAPTATEEELKKRRGKRPRTRAPSPRHRGRQKRERRAPKRRRKKGDKSKNGKAATVLVMYTLKHGRDSKGKSILLGPINRWIYASFAPKRHAFDIARREADKRGFGPGSEKLIQIVTDGDEDLERYGRETFPEAVHTLDVMHVLEYVWAAGCCLYREGSQKLERWFEKKKSLVYGGKITTVLGDLKSRRRKLSGPGSKKTRERLSKAITYLGKRLEMMPYDVLSESDLELASGSVEGAVKHLVAKRFDNGSMRWIKERAETLLQLRAIEVNGHWDQFIEFVDNRVRTSQEATFRPLRVLMDNPSPLPQVGVAA